MAAKKKADSAVVAGAPAPVAAVPPPAPPASIEAVAPPPAGPQYPKWVKGRIFATQAEHEASGPSYSEEA